MAVLLLLLILILLLLRGIKGLSLGTELGWLFRGRVEGLCEGVELRHFAFRTGGGRGEEGGLPFFVWFVEFAKKEAVKRIINYGSWQD